MKRDDVLARSREEHRNRELYEKEVEALGGNMGALVAIVLATIFFVVQVFVGGGMNYGLYAIIFAIMTTEFAVKAYKLKRKRDRNLAIVYGLASLVLSIAHIHHLVTTSTIL